MPLLVFLDVNIAARFPPGSSTKLAIDSVPEVLFLTDVCEIFVFFPTNYIFSHEHSFWHIIPLSFSAHGSSERGTGQSLDATRSLWSGSRSGVDKSISMLPVLL